MPEALCHGEFIKIRKKRAILQIVHVIEYNTKAAKLKHTACEDYGFISHDPASRVSFMDFLQEQSNSNEPISNHVQLQKN